MNRGIMIITFMIILLLGISCAYASDNTTNEAELSALESTDSVEIPADDVNLEDSATVNHTIVAADDLETAEENEKNNVLEESHPEDVKSEDLIGEAQDEVLMCENEDVLGVAPDDVLGEEYSITVSAGGGVHTITYLEFSNSRYFYTLQSGGSGYLILSSISGNGVLKTIIEGNFGTDPFKFSVTDVDCMYAISYEYSPTARFYLPHPVEAETTTTVTSLSKNYNSDSFDVSGTVKAGSDNVNGGTVTVTIESITKTATVSNGAWTASGFSSTSWKPGKYNIGASYGGVSGSYKSSSGSGNLTINKNTPMFNIPQFTNPPTYNGVIYLVSGWVTVTGNTNIATTNGFTLTVGTKTYTVDVDSQGKWTVSVDPTLLAPGSYSIQAKYIGNDYYNEKTATIPITIKKNTPIITSNDIATVTYNGNTYSISGTARASGSNSGLTSGTITLKTNTGVTLTGTTSWSSGIWSVNGISSTLLNPGTYTVTATYSSNDYYNEASSSGKSLTVNKMTSTVIVTGNPNFKYNINTGQLISGRISNSINGEYGGHVNITINNKLVKSNVAVNSDGTWSFTNYDTGRFLPNSQAYTITVSYSGNDFNKPSTGTGTYTVTKGDSIPMIVSGGGINVGENKTIKITVRDSKGFVKDSNVVLKGTGLSSEGIRLKTDSEGNAVFNVSGLASGYYADWMVIVEEDDRYIPLFNQTVEPFYVKEALNIIITDVDSYHSTYPDSIIIKGKVSGDANPVGSVNMTLGDKTVNAPLVNGVFTATFTGVVPGKYSTVTAVFIPDDSEHRYGGHLQDIHLDNDLIIDKFSPIIEITNVQLTKELYPGSVSVSFRLIGAGNGRLPTGRVDAVFEGRVVNEIFVNSSDVYTIDVGNLPEGKFNITLKYLGDNYYAENKNDTSYITILPDSMLSFIDNYYDVVSPSLVNVSSNMNGRTLMVYLDGNYYKDITVLSDKSQIDLGVLTAGNHTVTVQFEGDESFTKIYKSHMIFVEKLHSSVNVTATSVRTGNPVIVEVNASGNGIANIVIFNDKSILGKYNITINNGKGSFIVPFDFVEGNYNLNITYYGDEVYYGSANNTLFNVNDKIISQIKFIEPDYYIVNKTSTINIATNFPTGSLNVFVDGKKVNVIPVSDKTAQLILDYLSAGNHNILLTYDGDYDYTDATANITINVIKYDSLLRVDIAEPVHVDDMVGITIHVNRTAGGYVSVNVNNKDYHLKIKDSIARLNLTGLAYGTCTVSVNYLGDDYYNTNHTSKDFTISRYESNVAVANITIGDDLQINLTSFDGYDPVEVTGKLNITIGTITLTDLPVVEGKVIIPAGKLPGLPGRYDAVVKYSGNYKFLPSELTGIISINKLTAPVINPVLNVTIDDDLNITITGDERFTLDGNVSVKINDEDSFILPVVNGIFTIPYDKLPQFESLNNIKVTYANGTYYKDTVAEWLLHSDKITDYTFKITNDTIRFGENATLVIVLPDDVTASLTIKINGIDKTVNIVNGRGTLENINGLHAGLNTVTSQFTSGKYETRTADSFIQVNNNNITLTIIVPPEQLYVDETATVTVKANVTMNNTVTLYVNGKAETVKLTDGEGSFTIPKLLYGEYVFTAIFEGNENYTYATAGEKSFNVDKINITLNVTGSNVIVGHDITVKVNINDDATGLVIVKVDNNEYSLNVGNKNYALTVSGLSNGTHHIVAKYYGDSKYYGGENTTSFEVIKLSPSIDVNGTILIGEDLTVTITNSSSIVANATGKLTFTIGGKHVVVDVVGGVAIIKANDLPQVNDTYIATVSYSGDNNYGSLTESVSFTIEKVPELIITVPGNITIDDNMTISVGDETTDGKLNVTIGDGEMFTVDVVNGKAIIPVKYLPQASNTYAIHLDYYDGSYWDDVEYNASFHADKITDYTFTITKPVIKFGENATLEINLPIDVNTDLTVTINDADKTVKIINGYGKLENISGLHANENTVTSTFGSDKYETVTQTSTIQVNPNDITLTVILPVEQLYVDQSATIKVLANVSMNNEVIVYINGERNRTLKLDNGEASFTIPKLVYGKYVFTAVFEGNENYTQKTSDAKSFNVDKNNITLNVTADNIIVGHDGEVKVGIDGDATGLVIVRVDDSEYTLNVTNNEYTLTVSGLSNGTHNIVVKYYGDSKYYGGENTTSFEVIKLAPSIHVSSKILIGEDLTFSITNSSSIVANPTGKLTFTIGDTPVVVDVVNGVAIIKADDLPQVDGTYTATVEYSGDNNYDSLTESVSFAIEKDPSLIITVPGNVTIDDELVITVGDDTADGKLNVTIGNGAMFTVDVVKGIAVIPVKYLPQASNTYAISLNYFDGSYWDDTSVVRSFHADKVTDYPFIITNDTIKFDGVSTIRFTLPGDVNTTLTVLIDDIVKTVKITDGNGVLSIGNLHSGVNMVSTTFGNEKYETTSANGFIRVLANDITLNITVPDEQLYVDGEAVITVQANVTMNNTVTVYVNGEPRSLKLNDGKANFTIDHLVYGKYVFTAIFEGNENYTRANAEMKTFNVEKITPIFDVDVESILVGENALIQVTGLPEDATGIVLIDINGTAYSLKINKGKGNLTVVGLKYGEYDVVANFTGDNKYYSNINTASFNVDKNVIGEIKVSSGKIKDNKTQVTVTVEALDATGYVIIDVNNHTFSAKLLDGKTQIEVANLTLSENLFNVTYVGDDKYLPNMTNGVIIVDGIFIESEVNVTVDDIMVDGKAKFSISVFDDATGYVLLEVDGKEIRLPIFDAKAEFSLGNFKAGSYNVTATYLGDDKYYTSSNSTTFNVFKYANDITVEVEDGVAGTPITIEVIGDNADATGDVTITVDGVNYTAAMKDGAARFNVTVEKAGEFEVVAGYSGNDYYNGSIANNSFTLDSAAASLNITAEDIVIGEDAVIIVKLPVDATGNVTLSLKTTGNIYSSPIVDGVARFTIPDLKAGTYYITADYAGDIKYAPVTDDSSSFIVSKKNTANMISFNVNTDDDGTNVTVNVAENATGNITITMADNEISAPVVDGVAVINLGNLTGDKNVTISYTGDDVYAGFSENAVISTKSVKLNSKLTIEVTDINVGENANIIVHVIEDATGNVILSIDGKNYTSAIANAKATFNIGGLGNGTHAIIAYFLGDDKYLKSENKSAITVNKLIPSIVVSADDINVGDAANIVVEVPSDATGTVEITIGDEKYTASVSQGKAVFAVKGLANGTYTVSALYLGDAKYLTNTSSASFNVAKNSVDPVGDNKSSIKVETKDNKTVVTVDLPEDATGYVNITIGNETYNNVPVVNGTASIPVNNISENASISVAYSGDDKYGGFDENATATDEGVKLNAPVIVKLDKTYYAAGEKANIILAAPGDATGKLTVKVNGEVIGEIEGSGIIEYVVPAGGEFNIEVSYSGDKKYAPVSNSIAFTAEKTNSTTSISVDDTTFDENATVTVAVPDDAKGNVTLTVGDMEYTVNVTDGKAVFILPKLGIGKYAIHAVYNGDGKYEFSSADAEFTSDLKVVAENIVWGENATVSVISPNGTQGMLTVVCEKATFVVEITGSVMNFTFTGLLPGEHEVSVVYDRASDDYQVTIKKEIHVARLASDMTVSVDDVIVGNDVVIHVTVNSTGDVNGSLVSVTINGKEYNATIVNGTADIRISGLSVGKYENINVTFMGTQFVAPSLRNVTFNVNVLPVNLIGGKNINVFYLEGAQYSIRVMDMDGKPLSGIRVTFKVDGKTYNVVSDANGYAKVKLNLKPGNYRITASANGKSVSNNIKVKSIISAKKTTNVKKKAKKTIIKITVKGHKVKQSSKVKFTYKGKNKVKVKFGKDMKKQTVSVKFKGKTYKVKVNGKGKGTLKLTKKVAKKLRKGKKYSLKVTFKGPKLYKKVKVTVKFNGKKYKVKTNKAGVAKFKVTKKMVKKFKNGKKVKYTITYKQDTLKRFVKIK